MRKRRTLRLNSVKEYCKKHDLNDYTDDELKRLWDIYLAYKQRGGCLQWFYFVKIPIKKDPGDMTNERGEWTKFIRHKLAYEWDSIK